MTGHWPSLATGRSPRGCFVVGFSEDLEPRQVRPARYFDRDLVIWRSSAGEPREFDASGKCTDIPYAKRVPPKAQIKTHPREVVENVADIAHFGPIHGNEVLDFDAKFEGATATQSTHTTGYDKKGRLTKQHTVATYYGPGIQFSKMDGEFNTVIVSAHTPIDENNLELRMGLLVQGIDYGTKTGRLLGDMWIDALQSGYFQDVAIWEHKRWQDEPVLCDGDGPIGDLRR